jgi:hypothetical protein
MFKTCLMLRTSDKRKLLTHKKNLSLLQEYVNACGAEICLVKVDLKYQPEILELKALALALCNSTYNNPVRVENIERIFPVSSRARASTIRKFIKGKLLSGRPISLKELQIKYSINEPSLRYHLSLVRTQLMSSGYEVSKIGIGKYQILP